MRVKATDTWIAALNCRPADAIFLLNGVEIRGCHTADTDEGWVDCQVREPNNQLVEDESGKLKIVRRFGVVEVRLRDASPPA